MTVATGEIVRAANGNGEAKRQTVMGSLADRYRMDPNKLYDVIRATCIKGGNATTEQVQAFLVVANRYGLDPFLKEIYAFPAKSGGIVPIVGIDGWSKIANNTKLVDGCEFTFEGEGKSLACTCILHVKGRAHPTRVTEYMDECYRKTEPWAQWPRRMLRHKAWMQCVRVAFGFGGIYDEDEGREVIANESGRSGGSAAERARAVNAALRPHPTADTQVIDTTTSNEPAEPDAGEIIDVGDAPEPDVSGADAEPPEGAPPEFRTIEELREALIGLAMDRGQTESAVGNLMNGKEAKGAERPTTAGVRARQEVYAKALREWPEKG